MYIGVRCSDLPIAIKLVYLQQVLLASYIGCDVRVSVGEYKSNGLHVGVLLALMGSVLPAPTRNNVLSICLTLLQ